MAGDVDTIKARLSIEEVVGSYVELKQAGQYLKGSSPFANDSNPSFYVSPEKGLYHCFATDKGGDIFTFIQEMEGVDFRESLSILADRAGVELSGSSQSGKIKRLRKIVKEAVKFYRSYLQSQENGLSYFSSRGINERSRESFSLGQAPDEWRSLLTHLKESGYKENEIIEAGLAKKPDNGKPAYDRFRDRVMFPIFDSTDRAIAFSGRRLSDDQPGKYINSPETPLFQKKRVLYGYSHAKAKIRELNAAILVEGQTDLVLSHQSGLKNTVASSGTAITKEQLSLIQRLTDNIILALDTDTAGRESMLKVSRLAYEMDMQPKIAALPPDVDPADLISSDRKDTLKEAISAAEEATFVALNWVKENTEDRRSFLNGIEERVFPLVSSVKNDLTRDHFIAEISRRSDVREKTLRSQLQKARPQREGQPPQEKNATESLSSQILTAGERKRQIYENALSMLAWQRDSDEPVIDTENSKERLESIIEYDVTGITKTEIDESDIMAQEMRYAEVPEKKIKSDFEELLLNLEEQILKSTYRITSRKLSKEDDKETKSSLLKKCQKMSARIHELREKIRNHV